ncbi:MAG: UDP-N-acetylglucosamine 2-epimerase [Candidatus Angelobacter sp.]|nr:UDP-N-acetylglucosamine 2-epimerase [Candidatus Angelobacter sp.]
MVSSALREHPELTEVLIHTGQHYDRNMSQVFLDELRLPEPAYNLRIGSGDHGSQTGRMMEAIEDVLVNEGPDWVLVYGDTNSTLAGALAACKLGIPVAHIEAGVRSFDRRMPEEINRVVTDHVSDLLLAPTAVAVENLRREGISGKSVRIVGDVMYDAVLHFGCRAESDNDILQRLGLERGKYILFTLHRAENTDDVERFELVMDAVQQISKSVTVVFPVHPRTRNAFGQSHLQYLDKRHLLLLEPVSYIEMLRLERNARVIATDSGGVQKEAFFYQVPCVTLREQTEWVELVEMGWNRLAPPLDVESIVSAVQQSFGRTGDTARQPYGNGRAAQQIVKAILEPRALGQLSQQAVEPGTDRASLVA